MKVDAVEGRAPRNRAAGTWNWSVRAIRWRDVFHYQHWGAIPVLIPALILLLLAHYSFQKHPRIRTAYVYDATISYPSTGDTISNGLVALFPWLAMLISVVVVEFGLYYQQQSITTSAAALLHMLLSCFVNFIIVLAASEVTKAVVGQLRPNFLARCQPSAAQLNAPFTFQEAVVCTNPDVDAITDGRLSFVSGHSSNTMSTSWFTTLYLIWSLYWRDAAPYATQVFGGTRMRRILFELMYAFLYWWMLFVLLLSWYSSCSRIWDNQHSTADILGGIVLGLILTTPYVFKAFGQYAVFKRELDTVHETTLQGAQQLAVARAAERDGTGISVLPPVSTSAAPHRGNGVMQPGMQAGPYGGSAGGMQPAPYQAYPYNAAGVAQPTAGQAGPMNV